MEACATPDDRPERWFLERLWKRSRRSSAPTGLSANELESWSPTTTGSSPRESSSSPRRCLQDLAERSIVVAPDREQSASGHSLTLHRPLRMRAARGERPLGRRHAHRLRQPGGRSGCSKTIRPTWSSRASTSVCNLGEDVTYSGTVSATFEGTLLGIPSIALSVRRSASTSPSSPPREVATIAGRHAARRRAPRRDLLLNVNIPARQDPGSELHQTGPAHLQLSR